MAAELATLGRYRRRQQDEGLITDTFLERFDFHDSAEEEPKRDKQRNKENENGPRKQAVKDAAGDDPWRKRDWRGRRHGAGLLRGDSAGAGRDGNWDVARRTGNVLLVNSGIFGFKNLTTDMAGKFNHALFYRENIENSSGLRII